MARQRLLLGLILLVVGVIACCVLWEWVRVLRAILAER